jgi:valyl-tRNA synthetase
MNGCRLDAQFDPGAAEGPINRWIIGEVVKTAGQVTEALDACAFDAAASALYRFIWNVYCDWYLEFAKPILQGTDEGAKTETRAAAAWVLETILKLLHPVMPFITEELWGKTAERGEMLICARWPELPGAWIDEEVAADMALVVGAIASGRAIRSELNVPLSARPPLIVSQASPRQKEVLAANEAAIAMMLRVSGLSFEGAAGAVPYVAEGAAFALPIAQHIDLAAERTRLGKEIAGHAADIERTSKKLGNADFLARAPEEVVEENRERLAESRSTKDRLEAALARLESVS